MQITFKNELFKMYNEFSILYFNYDNYGKVF